MPVVVPDTSVLHQSPSRAGHGRSHSGAGQAAEPFSDLLASPEDERTSPAPERVDVADRSQSKPSARIDKHSAKHQSTTDPTKPVKSKTDTETKDTGKTEAAAVPEDAEKTTGTNNESGQPSADIGVKTDVTNDIAVSGSEPDPSLLLAAIPAPDSITNTATVLQTVAVPVVAPAPPPVDIATTTPTADTSMTGTETAAVAAAVAAPSVVAAAAPIDVKPETDAPAAADITNSAQPAAPGKQFTAPFKGAVAEPKTEATAKADSTVAQASTPHADAENTPHTTRTSKAPEAAAGSSEPKAPNPRPEVAAKSADGRAEAPVSAVDANIARTAPETASNTNPNALPAPAAVSAPGAAHAAQAATTPSTQAAPAVPLASLAIEIAAKAQGGKNRFEIRLDPPELGRIHVRLDFDHDGNVTSRLVVDRSETLDLLRRDAPNLERAFQQAGLKTSDNGLQFSLRDQSFSGRDNGAQTQPMARLVVPEDKLVAINPQRNHTRLAGLRGGVDIRV